MNSDDRSFPLVSIVVLNYKRRQALEQCLRSVVAQDYPHREILVVDNHSEDGAEEMVRTMDPAIRWIGLSSNLGTCAGRNAGIRETRGAIVVTLDNDVLFASSSELEKLVRAFDHHPEADVLAFQVCDQATGKIRGREWCHPKNILQYGNSEFETSFFAEGAVAFRHNVFAQAGLYYEPFFIGCEGGDLVFRILDKGFRILYCPMVRVFHLMEPETRSSDRPYYFYTRNYIWIAYKDYSFRAGLRYLFPKLLMMGFFAVRTGKYLSFLRGVKDAIAGLPMVRKSREPISHATVTRFLNLEHERPGWAARLVRHRLQPQI